MLFNNVSSSFIGQLLLYLGIISHHLSEDIKVKTFSIPESILQSLRYPSTVFSVCLSFEQAPP